MTASHNITFELLEKLNYSDNYLLLHKTAFDKNFSPKNPVQEHAVKTIHFLHDISKLNTLDEETLRFISFCLMGDETEFKNYEPVLLDYLMKIKQWGIDNTQHQEPQIEVDFWAQLIIDEKAQFNDLKIIKKSEHFQNRVKEVIEEITGLNLLP